MGVLDGSLFPSRVVSVKLGSCRTCCRCHGLMQLTGDKTRSISCGKRKWEWSKVETQRGAVCAGIQPAWQ